MGRKNRNKSCDSDSDSDISFDCVINNIKIKIKGSSVTVSTDDDPSLKTCNVMNITRTFTVPGFPFNSANLSGIFSCNNGQLIFYRYNDCFHR
jgi:hypothetical protein